jgi:ABC-type glycerol-3-phosphate transport system permease component
MSAGTIDVVHAAPREATAGTARSHLWNGLRRRSLSRAVICAVVFVFFALPLFLLVISAFSTNATITTFQWPSSFTWSNFSHSFYRHAHEPVGIATSQ